MRLYQLDATVHVLLTLIDVSLAHFLQKKVWPCCNSIVPGYSETDRCQYCLRKVTEDCHKTAQKESRGRTWLGNQWWKTSEGHSEGGKMKIKCTEDRQEDAILVEKLKNDSRYTEAKTELSKFCRDLGKTNLRVPCVKTAESFKWRTLMGVLVFQRKMYILTLRWTQDKKAQLQGCAATCLIPGGGEMVEPWVCTQVLQGPTRMHRLYAQVKTEWKHWQQTLRSPISKCVMRKQWGCCPRQGRNTCSWEVSPTWGTCKGQYRPPQDFLQLCRQLPGN